MARDGWTKVASYLRADEAEVLCGLLESAGIDALVEDAAIAALNPLLQSAIGGAKVLVPAADAARAASILSESGLFEGAPGESAEIPEEEWSAAPDPRREPTAAPARAEPLAPADRASAHALRASFAGLALSATIVVPLYALTASVRALRLAGAPARSRARSRWALAVSALALLLGLGSWAWIFPALPRPDRIEQRERMPTPPRGHPARP